MFNSYDELSKYVQEESIRMLDFKIPDLKGQWHHLTIPAKRLKPTVFSEGFGFDGSNYGYTSVESSDLVFIPDFRTAFFDPFWQEATLSFLGHIYEITPEGKRLFPGESRNILSRSLDYLRQSGIADQLILGPEFEYYILDQVNFWNDSYTAGYKIMSRESPGNMNDVEDNGGYKIRTKDGYHKDSPHDLYRDLRSAISLAVEELGIKIKYHHHEVGGPGQQEIEVEPAEAGFIADASLLIKYFVKNMAHLQGKTATFMPKPFYGEAGNGFHVHIQLFKNGQNLFQGPQENYAGLSNLALQFIGGILLHTRSLMAFAAPSTNSYKRLVKGYEAPIAISFATGNRSAVIRIPGYATAPQKKRFEFRPGDATSNPYLYFAALLMAGLDGIYKEIDPLALGFGPLEKNIYNLSREEEAKLQFLPGSLQEALKALEEDHDFLLAGNIFSPELINNWINNKKQEIEAINSYPTPQEFAYYFDL